ncbi:MAG: ATP-binding protein [Gemmatimonadota bacterium]|nr:ATP-binding protein [Gemmatimonadota bacterium]
MRVQDVSRLRGDDDRVLRSATTERRLAAALEPVQVLYWMYAVRLLFSIGVFGSSLLIQDLTQPQLPGLFSPEYRVATLGLSAATLLTPLAYWYSHRRRLKLGVVFIYAQAMLDILLVNGIVHLTGGSSSYFTFLFIPLAAVYALILPLGPAVLVALASGLIYLIATLLAFPGTVAWGLLLQVGIFTMVAVLASLLGARFQQVRIRLRSVEGELRRLELDTADVLRIVPSGVLTVDEDWRLVYMNLAAADLLQIDVDTWLGRELRTLLEVRSISMATALREAMETGRRVRNREIELLPPLVEPHALPAAFQAPDGEAPPRRDPIPVALSTSSLQGAGSGASFVVLLQDLRPARQLEDLRLRTGRLQAVAELSASLAHELRNPIASVRSAVEQLSGRAHASESDQVLGRLITRESDRLSRILGDFSDFARVDVASREPIDVDRLIRDVVETVAHHPGADGRAVFDRQVAPDLGGLWGDRELLHRTLLNLVLNAVQVGDPDGTVNIRIVADALRPDLVPQEMSLGVPVRIRVMDDGPGIDPADLPRIFDPFFTRRQGGSGLGLSVAHRAVQAHGGALIATSTPGRGATFAIVLPRRGHLPRPPEGVDDRRTVNADFDQLLPERG